MKAIICDICEIPISQWEKHYTIKSRIKDHFGENVKRKYDVCSRCYDKLMFEVLNKTRKEGD